MANKKECEIVQDLLLNYVDGLLNPESKKLVEKHLSECEECRESLKLIQEDTKRKDNREPIELDYLKKIRIKSRIKSILIALAIILLIATIIFLNKFAKVTSIMSRAEKTLQSNNFYKETTQILYDNSTSVTKEYYKDGKYKYVWEIYTDEGVEIKKIEYANIDSDERTYIYETEKRVEIEKNNISKMKNKTNSIKNVPFVIGRNNLFANIGTTFVYSIDTDTYANGKKCYVLHNRAEKDKWEIRIDKETGLPIKQITRGGEKIFYQDTNVVKSINDVVEEYKYEFNKVTDEDVKIPDISNYAVENKTS